MSDNATFEVHNLTKFSIQVSRNTSKLTVDSFDHNSHPTSRSSLSCREVTLCLDDASQAFEVKLPKLVTRSAIKWRQVKMPLISGLEAPIKLFYMATSRTEEKLIALPNRNMSSHLAAIPDSVHLSNILLPGTHDSMSLYGWPFAQCQTRPLLEQLQGGIRAIDIRLSIVKNTLTAYHGIVNQVTLFTDIVATLYAFLRSPAGRRECIVMSIKQEDFASSSPALFSSLIHDIVFNSSFDGNLQGKGITLRTTGRGPLPPPASDMVSATSADMWFLENRVPNLGEVRGKIVLFSRFGDGTGWDGGLEGTGIHPTRWPDSPTTEWFWDCKDTTFQSQDWYNIGSVGNAQQKFALATSALITHPVPSDPTSSLHHTLPVSFSSASSIPLALPCMVATGLGVGSVGYVGVNPRIAQWALDVLSKSSKSFDAKARVQAVSRVLMMPQPPTQANEEKKQQVADFLAKDSDPNALEQAPPTLQRISGWLMMDYFEQPSGTIPLLVEMNFINDRLRGVSVEDMSLISTVPPDGEPAAKKGWWSWGR